MKIKNLTVEQLWKLRSEIRLGGLFIDSPCGSDYENSLKVNHREACDFFDGFLDYIEEKMYEDDENFSDEIFWETLPQYDNKENLIEYFYAIEW